MTDLHPCCFCCSYTMRISLPPPLCNDGAAVAAAATTYSRAKSRAKKKCSEFVELLLIRASKPVSRHPLRQASQEKSLCIHCYDALAATLVNDDSLFGHCVTIGASDDGSCRQSSQIRIMFFAFGKPSIGYGCRCCCAHDAASASG